VLLQADLADEYGIDQDFKTDFLTWLSGKPIRLQREADCPLGHEEGECFEECTT